MRGKEALARRLRCAIYTRKSSEEGLDQSFNSLHAQREACEAYVKSQAAEGWIALPTLYDDGGFSGGNMERPALRRLLADISAGAVDVVVVYKIDRLTRSLADFAKIVDVFDARGVSFVSVTQAFNTTSSMGRLTLNVLLSFAQFEREVTGERIRDKIAASKKKGMWMGGTPPLGYDPPTDPTTRALVVNPSEAATVRMIFERYLELGSVSVLADALEAEGVRSKAWTTRSGRELGGCRMNRGALFHLLRNRVYLGEIPHCEESYPGAHPAIVDPSIFGQVKIRLDAHHHARRKRPTRVSTAPLRGKLFDTDGRAMSPTFGHGSKGRIYRYYVSTPLQQGRAVADTPGAIRRVSAGAIETLLTDALRPWLRAPAGAPFVELATAVHRVEVEANAMRLILERSALNAAGIAASSMLDESRAHVVLPVRCKLRGGRSWVIKDGEPAKALSRVDPTLVRGLRQAHQLMAQFGWRASDGGLDDPNATAPPNPYRRRLCRLVFLAPDIQRAILDGTQPPGLHLELLMKEPIPLSWAEQRRRYREL